jgi:two-component sensor histidine kinase
MALDQAFNANTLHVLRKAVLVEAAAAGMPDDRATEVMLAVHELAANAVCHGGGTGQARMGAIRPWPFQPGHGLWLVRNAADHVSVASGLGGSEVTAVFTLPGVSA